MKNAVSANTTDGAKVEAHGVKLLASEECLKVNVGWFLYLKKKKLMVAFFQRTESIGINGNLSQQQHNMSIELPPLVPIEYKQRCLNLAEF